MHKAEKVSEVRKSMHIEKPQSEKKKRLHTLIHLAVSDRTGVKLDAAVNEPFSCHFSKRSVRLNIVRSMRS